MADPEILKSLHLVQKDGEAAVSPFVQLVVEELAGGSVEYTGYAVPSSTPTAAAEMAALLLSMFADAVASNVSESKFTSTLQKLGIGSDIVPVISSALFSKKESVVRRHLDRLTTSSDKTHLIDFDWGIHHAISSSKLTPLGETLVGVTFNLGGAGGEKLSLELSPLELDALINTMESAVEPHR